MKSTVLYRTTLAALVAVLCSAASVAVAQDAVSVSEHGFGTGVEERKLVGKADKFTEGSQVWFWTRVTGAEAGERIHHVWIKDGEEVLTVGLSLGGSHWRTWSNKRMHPGSVGAWKVEVRASDGRVVTSAEFSCEAAEE